MKKKYRIYIDGCHDSTIIEKELTEDELKTIQSVEREMTETSEYGCMPTIIVRQVEEF